MEIQSINGAAGPLEVIWRKRGNERSALLCHPHPLYGGSMYDAVLDALDRACDENNISSLRFNMRGVGRSAGAHDKGVGEAQDVITLANWLDNEQPGELVLCGYSFGAMMVLEALPEVPGAAAVLVAPPVVHMKKASTVPPSSLTLAILGEQDQIVDAQSTAEWLMGGGNVQLHRIPGADHFFAGEHDTITGVVSHFLRPHHQNAE